MKVKRYKRTRRVLAFYKRAFALRGPYRVAVDGAYIQAALEGRVQIAEQLPKLLQDDARAFTTKCVLSELSRGGKHYSGATQIARSLSFLKCRHDGVVPGAACIELLVQGGNRDFLCVGAGDPELRDRVRNVPGVPVLFVRGNVPILETPSELDRGVTEGEELARMEASEAEKRAAAKARREEEGGGEPRRRVMPKRKVAKGPNPLAVKKKKKKKNPAAAEPAEPEKSKEKRPREEQAHPAAAEPPKKRRRRKRGKGKGKKDEAADTNT